MEFTVWFETWLRGDEVICFFQKSIGMEEVDAIRTEIGCNLPLERIQGKIEQFRENRVGCILSEEKARSAGVFLQTNSVRVIVPPNWGNQATEKYIFTEKDTKTAEIVSAGYWYRIDRKQLYEMWKEAGFKLNLTE